MVELAEWLRDKKMGAYSFTLSLEVPTKSLEADKESSVTLPEIAPVGTILTSGVPGIAVMNNLI